MNQREVPLNEETYGILNFLSGNGFWLILALTLVGVLLYRRFKK